MLLFLGVGVVDIMNRSFAPVSVEKTIISTVSRLFRSASVEFVCWAALIALALGVRMVALDDRPMHADEAVQAAITRDLWLSGRYRYNPHEFHGPTLNYLSVPFLWLSGRDDFADTTAADFRRVPALFGAAAILFLLLLRDGLGRGAAVAASGLLALSPSMVFYARSYIHETLLAFFTLAAIACGWRCWRRARNDDGGEQCRTPGKCGRRRAAVWGWAAAFGTAVGMMQATKETAVLSFAAAAAALGCTAIAFRRRADRSAPASAGSRADAVFACPADQAPADRAAVKQGFSCFSPLPEAALVAVISAVATVALWFSSLGRNPQGIVDAVRTYTPWTQRAAGASPHVQPVGYFAQRLLFVRDDQGRWWSEGVIALAAVLGGSWAWRKTKGQNGAAHSPAIPTVSSPEATGGGRTARKPADCSSGDPRLIVFLAFYSATLALIYSLIPYKTPWCMVQFWLPAILAAGSGIGVLGQWTWSAAGRRTILGATAAIAGGLLIAAAFAQLGRQTYRAAFVFAADPRNPYCCAPTLAGIGKLAQRLDALPLAWPDRPIGAAIVWHDGYYWPLPWYLRRFAPVGYWTSLPANTLEETSLPENTKAIPEASKPSPANDAGALARAGAEADPFSMPVIIASARFDAPLTERLGETHLMIDFYAMRPDAMLMLWVREDLWMAHLKRLGRL